MPDRLDLPFDKMFNDIYHLKKCKDANLADLIKYTASDGPDKSLVRRAEEKVQRVTVSGKMSKQMENMFRAARKQNSMGVYSAAQLRQLSSHLKALDAATKIFEDYKPITERLSYSLQPFKTIAERLAYYKPIVERLSDSLQPFKIFTESFAIQESMAKQIFGSFKAVNTIAKSFATYQKWSTQIIGALNTVNFEDERLNSYYVTSTVAMTLATSLEERVRSENEYSGSANIPAPSANQLVDALVSTISQLKQWVAQLPPDRAAFSMIRLIHWAFATLLIPLLFAFYQTHDNEIKHEELRHEIQVNHEEVTGEVRESCSRLEGKLNELTNAISKKEASAPALKILVITATVNLHEAPESGSHIVTTLYKNESVNLLDVRNGWCQISIYSFSIEEYQQGWLPLSKTRPFDPKIDDVPFSEPSS